MRGKNLIMTVSIGLLMITMGMLVGYGIAAMASGAWQAPRYSVAVPPASPPPTVRGSTSKNEPVGSDLARPNPTNTMTVELVVQVTASAMPTTAAFAAQAAPAPIRSTLLPTATEKIASTAVPTATDPVPTAKVPPPTATTPPPPAPRTPTSVPRPSLTPLVSTTIPTQAAQGSNGTTTSTGPTRSILIDDTFSDATSGWPIQETKTWNANYTKGQYQLVLHGETRIGISYPLMAQNYRLSADVAVKAGGAGLVFLFEPDDAFYWFGISADGAYCIQKLQGDQATNVVGWTASDTLLKAPGEPVKLRIERRDKTLQFFARDQLLSQLTVPAGNWENRYGFVITSQAQQADATFDNLLGERLNN